MAHSVHVRLELRHGAPPHAAPAAGTPSPDCGGLSAPSSPQGDLSLQWSSSPIVCPARLSGVCSSCRASIGCVCVCGCEHEACVLSVRCVCDRRGVRACICSMCLCVCACVMWGGAEPGLDMGTLSEGRGARRHVGAAGRLHGAGGGRVTATLRRWGRGEGRAGRGRGGEGGGMPLWPLEPEGGMERAVGA